MKEGALRCQSNVTECQDKLCSRDYWHYIDRSPFAILGPGRKWQALVRSTMKNINYKKAKDFKPGETVRDLFGKLLVLLSNSFSSRRVRVQPLGMIPLSSTLKYSFSRRSKMRLSDPGNVAKMPEIFRWQLPEAGRSRSRTTGSHFISHPFALSFSGTNLGT